MNTKILNALAAVKKQQKNVMRQWVLFVDFLFAIIVSIQLEKMEQIAEELPEGMKGHCNKTEQAHKPWYADNN